MDVNQVHVVVGIAHVGDRAVPQREALEPVGPRRQWLVGALDVAHAVGRIVDVGQEDLAAAGEAPADPVHDAPEPLAEGGLPQRGLIEGAAVHLAVLGRLAAVGVNEVVAARRDDHDAPDPLAEERDARHLPHHVVHRRRVADRHVVVPEIREDLRQVASRHVGDLLVVVEHQQVEVAPSRRGAESPRDAVAQAEQHHLTIGPHPLEGLGGHGRPGRAAPGRRHATLHRVVVGGQHHEHGHPQQGHQSLGTRPSSGHQPGSSSRARAYRETNHRATSHKSP